MAQTEAQRQWYLKNKERLKAKARKYSKENRDKLNAAKRNWVKENKEKVKEYQQRYREKHKEAIQERHKKWVDNNKEANKEHKKKWEESNKGKVRAKNSRRRVRKVSATIEGFNSEISEIYEDCSLLCLVTGDYYEVDHIVPLQGKTVCGLHVPWNLQILHRKDNRSKGNKHE